MKLHFLSFIPDKLLQLPKLPVNRQYLCSKDLFYFDNHLFTRIFLYQKIVQIPEGESKTATKPKLK